MYGSPVAAGLPCGGTTSPGSSEASASAGLEANRTAPASSRMVMRVSAEGMPRSIAPQRNSGLTSPTRVPCGSPAPPLCRSRKTRLPPSGLGRVRISGTPRPRSARWDSGTSGGCSIVPKIGVRRPFSATNSTATKRRLARRSSPVLSIRPASASDAPRLRAWRSPAGRTAPALSGGARPTVIVPLPAEAGGGLTLRSCEIARGGMLLRVASSRRSRSNIACPSASAEWSSRAALCSSRWRVAWR
jgi:hypothetical protein